MELTPGRQRLVFVVVVIVLVGLCIFLIRSRHSGGTPPESGSASPSASPAGAQANGVPSAVPAVTPASTVGGAEIYQWLPFTAADLSAAAQTTLTFAKDYSTWSYTESANDYAATMSGLVNAQQLALIKSGYSTAGTQGLRTTDKQVSTGSGSIDSIRSFGTSPTSITFVVTITQQVTSAQSANTQSGQYAITVAMSGGAWQVNDLQLARLGNQ